MLPVRALATGRERLRGTGSDDLAGKLHGGMTMEPVHSNDVLTSDAAEAFVEAPGGFYDQELAGRMVETLFSPRNSIDPAEAYRQFRGRDATIEPLMRDRGFPVPGED